MLLHLSAIKDKKLGAESVSYTGGRDNLHGFLDQCFSRLLKAVFGYDGASWLTTAAKVCKFWSVQFVQGTWHMIWATDPCC